MFELQRKITEVQSTTDGLRRHLVDNATREYFTTLDVLGRPAATDFEAAQERARLILKQELLSPESVSLINGSALDQEGLAQLAVGFDTIARPLRIPGPILSAEARSTTLALAAAAGAFGGLLLLAALMRLALEMPDLGMTLGAPIGAFLAVLLACRLARTRIAAKVLPWLFVRAKALGGAKRREHEKAVQVAIEQWVDWAVPMLAVLCAHRIAPAEVRTDTDKALRRIGKLIYALQQSPSESLPVVAHELIQEAKNSGFEGLEGQPVFISETPRRPGDAGGPGQETMIWEPRLQSQYETFGHISEGDRVAIERPAVVFGGRIVQRGLVRRVRNRA